MAINLRTINAELNNILQNVDQEKFQAAAQKAAGVLKAKTQAAITAVGEAKNGIKSLAQTDDGDIDNPPSAAETPCEITGDVEGLKDVLIKKPTTANESSVSAITGSGSVQPGKLNKMITAGSPEAFAAAIQKTTGKSLKEIQAVVEKTVDDPAIKSALADLEASITQGVGGASKLTEATANLQDKLKFSTPQVTDDLFGNIALKLDKSISNTIGSVIDALQKVGVEGLPKVNEVLRDISDEKHDDVIRTLGELDTKDVIPKDTLDTTIRSVSLKPSNVIVADKPPAVGEKTIPCFIIGSNENQWKGANTPTTPPPPSSTTRGLGTKKATPAPTSSVFSFVNSKEELIAEMEHCKRPITEVVVHWAGTYLNQDLGAEDIHQWHKQKGWSGIGYHYIMRRDGRLQRGRPIGKTGAHAGDNGHNKYSIGISFIAGYNCPTGTKNSNKFISADSITPEQMKTFEMFMSSFYHVWPGGQAYGHVDTDNKGKIDPGFDVQEYVLSKFNKRNINKSGKISPLSPVLLAQARSDTKLA
jgi:N-acetylmuramoyl-L-alanine amidase